MDMALGNDLTWARTGNTSKIQRVAVKSDNAKGLDLTWARTSKLSRVRKSVAHCDFDANRDLLWSANDVCKGVRYYYEKTKVIKKPVA